MFFSSPVEVSQEVPRQTHFDRQFLYLPSEAIEKSPMIQSTSVSTHGVQQDVVEERDRTSESPMMVMTQMYLDTIVDTI